MNSYTIIFTGNPTFNNPEEAKINMSKYMEWTAKIGDKFINQGTPLGDATIVSSNGVSEDDNYKLTGYAIIQTETREEIIELIKECPFLVYGDIKICENKVMKRQ